MPSLKLANSSPAPGLEKRSRSEPRALGTHQQFSATDKGRGARRAGCRCWEAQQVPSADPGLHFHQGFSWSQWKPCYQSKCWLDLIRWLCNEEQVRVLLAEGQRLGGLQ